MQLRDHAFGELADTAVQLDVGLGEKFHGSLPVEAWMHAGDEVDGL